MPDLIKLLISFFKKKRSSPIKSSTSDEPLFQFSEENANNVKCVILFSTAAFIIFLAVPAPCL